MKPVFFLLLLHISLFTAAKIKLIDPSLGKKILLHGPLLTSHVKVFQGVAAALAEEGYNVSLLVANNSKLIS